MGALTLLEKENMHRQSELIHVSLGFHEARMQKGHPFALDTGTQPMTMRHGEQGPHTLLPLLRAAGRKQLDITEDSKITSPITRISWGVTASMWDTVGQMLGTHGHETDDNFSAFVQDETLHNLIETSHRAGDEIQSNSDPFHFPHYRGAGTLYSGYEVGIRMMTTFAAIKEALPDDFNFHPLALSRVIGHSGDKLSLAEMDMFLWHLDPTKLADFLDPKERLGVVPQKIDEYPPSEIRCPALLPMGDKARDILKRHGMYDERRDHVAGMKVMYEQIEREVRKDIVALRVTLDFIDANQLPPFDRSVVNKNLVSIM